MNQALSIVYDILDACGIHAASNRLLAALILAVCAIALSSIAYYILRRYVGRIIDRITLRTTFKWDDILLRPQFMHWLWMLIAVMICSASLPPSFAAYPQVASVLRVVMKIVTMLTIMKIVIELIKSAFLLIADNDNVDDIARKMREANSRGEDYHYQASHSLKGLQQMLIIIVVAITMILVVSQLLGKNPIVIFSGIGAGAAVLMLVFKDSILGVVAGVQLTANDMLQPGDWITAPKYGADGIVQEVTLATVKIQNWDKTIVTIPPYSLVSDAFQNWRGMKDSGGRRIKRSFNIDMTSMRFITPAEAERFKGKPWAADIDIVAGQTVNLALFRRFLEYYIGHRHDTHTGMTFMIRELQPGEHGLPVEMYFFSANTDWVYYEHLQADVLDYVIASMGDFGLRVYQAPTGADLQALAR